MKICACIGGTCRYVRVLEVRECVCVWVMEIREGVCEYWRYVKLCVGTEVRESVCGYWLFE